jgi:hypothetical protein
MYEAQLDVHGVDTFGGPGMIRGPTYAGSAFEAGGAERQGDTREGGEHAHGEGPVPGRLTDGGAPSSSAYRLANYIHRTRRADGSLVPAAPKRVG